MTRLGLALVIVLALSMPVLAQATKIATSGTLPTHCTVGNIYLKTGAAAGLYTCLATDTWTAINGIPGGADTQAQVNESGVFGGSDALTVVANNPTLSFKGSVSPITMTGGDDGSGDSAIVVDDPSDAFLAVNFQQATDINVAGNLNFQLNDPIGTYLGGIISVRKSFNSDGGYTQISANGFNTGTFASIHLNGRAADGTGGGIDVTGPVSLAGDAPSVANVGANSCGTTAAAIAGNDNAGTITVGATSGSQCRVTFVKAATTRRECTVTDETTTIATRATYVDVSNTDFLGSFGADDLVSYVCFAR